LGILQAFNLLQSSTSLQNDEEGESTINLPLSQSLFSPSAAQPTTTSFVLTNENILHQNLQQCKYGRNCGFFFDLLITLSTLPCLDFQVGPFRVSYDHHPEHLGSSIMVHHKAKYTINNAIQVKMSEIRMPFHNSVDVSHESQV
jgi:hypothetical protein